MKSDLKNLPRRPVRRGLGALVWVGPPGGAGRWAVDGPGAEADWEAGSGARLYASLLPGVGVDGGTLGIQGRGSDPFGLLLGML